MSQVIIVVNADDWAGVYVHDTLVFEGHSIPDFVLLEAAPGCTGAMRYEVDLDWMSEEGNLPASFIDIPSEHLSLRDLYP